MSCHGGVDPTGVAAIKGVYGAPPGPGWGRGILMQPEQKGAFRLSMYYIPPGGEMGLAVEADSSRVPAGREDR